MKLKVCALSLVLGFFELVTCSGILYSEANQVLSSCKSMIRDTLIFCSEEEKYTCPCTNVNAMATIMGCGVIGFKVSVEEFKKELLEFCEKEDMAISESNAEEAFFLYQQNAVHTSSIPNFNKSEPLDLPIILDEDKRILYGESYFDFYGNLNKSVYYGSGLLGYWGLVLLIAMVSNWSRKLLPQLVFKLNGAVTNKWRSYVTLPATYSKLKNQSLDLGNIQIGLIPSRWESIVISIFTILCIAFNAHYDSYQEGNPVFKTKSEAVSRYVADRTGITATCMIPLLILFAGRNNFLCFVT